MAAVPILRELRTLLPEHELLLSVMTEGGHEMAEQQAARYIDGLFYFPFDLFWVARRVVLALRPSVFVSLESEMWPNVLHTLKQQGTVTVMVNGRISDRNFRRVRRSGRLLFRWMLNNMDRMLMQSEADAEKVRILLGSASGGNRVGVVGNSKFDQEIAHLTPGQVLQLRTDLKLPEEAPVFVAGSTRSTEEEMEVIRAYKLMQQQFHDLCLVIAPRHIDRAEEVAASMRQAGLEPVRKTELDAAHSPVRHLILDTMGELAGVYAVATFAFVGNSFEPVVKGGGQNLLQPLAHGKPVLFGPRTATIRSEVDLVKQSDVGFQVADGNGLAALGVRLLQEESLRCRIERDALALIAANRGVSKRYAQAVAALAGVTG